MSEIEPEAWEHEAHGLANALDDLVQGGNGHSCVEWLVDLVERRLGLLVEMSDLVKDGIFDGLRRCRCHAGGQEGGHPLKCHQSL